MKKFSIVLLVAVIAYSCTNNPPKKETVQADQGSIEGTWVLKYYKDVDSNTPDEWTQYGEEIIYEKFITDTHFIWVKYNKTTSKMEGAGGGTYRFEGGKYVEDIEFFFPPGSNELGQAIPFEHERKDGEWYHKGYAKIMDMDVETGDMVMTDSMKIEERWVRSTEMSNTENTSLVGSWSLESYRGKADSTRQEYPEFIRYMKLITPSHFAWVQFDAEGDMVYGLGTGTYYFEDGKYVEAIRTMYPNGPQQQGTVVPFEMEIAEEGWKHVGNVILKNKQENGEIITEPMYIDEMWKKYEANM